MKMRKSIGCLILLGLFVCLTGCATLFPSSRNTIVSPWKNFEDIEAAYAKITIGQTITEVHKLGFDPRKVPNIEILNFVQMREEFIPQNSAIRINNLPEEIQLAFKAKDRATAYKIEYSDINKEVAKKTAKSWWLYTIKFNRSIDKTGWQFKKGIIVFVDDVVAYKLKPGAKPKLQEKEEEKKPLGPFQELGDWVIGIGGGLL